MTEVSSSTAAYVYVGVIGLVFLGVALSEYRRRMKDAQRRARRRHPAKRRINP